MIDQKQEATRAESLRLQVGVWTICLFLLTLMPVRSLHKPGPNLSPCGQIPSDACARTQKCILNLDCRAAHLTKDTIERCFFVHSSYPARRDGPGAVCVPFSFMPNSAKRTKACTCSAPRFCSRTSLASLPGTCTSCWQCCLFPKVYGTTACDSRCRCAASQPCSMSGDCGPGEFCAVLLSRSELPVCQPCHLCRNNSQALQGSCADSCSSGALDDNGVPQGAEAHFMFAAFDIANHAVARMGMTTVASTESDALTIFVSEDSLRVWLDKQPQETNSPRKGCGIPCHKADQTPGLSHYGCPAGQRCSPRSWVSLPGDVITLGGTSLLKVSNALWWDWDWKGCPLTHVMNRVHAAARSCIYTTLYMHKQAARCVPCEPGTYCPEGTFVEEQDDFNFMASLVCPKGYYCPTPAEKYECPAGYFCPERSTANITCDYMLMLGPQVGNVFVPAYKSFAMDTATQATSDRRPLKGNYCPNRSTAPSQSCSPGYYCPDPSLEILCPPGHYCRAESIQPTSCPPLTLCAAGSNAPRIWPAAVAVFCGLAFSVYVAGVMTTKLNALKAPRSHADYNADQDKRAAAARTLRRFIARFHNGQVTTRRRQVAWRVEPHRLEMKELGWVGPGRPGKPAVLQCVTGCFEPGNMSAILGPSGCGKSSLLALLAGRGWPLSSGEVLVNGKLVTKPKELRHVTGLVPQDDILSADLTVQEIFDFSAALRLPKPSSFAASHSGKHLDGSTVGAAGNENVAGALSCFISNAESIKPQCSAGGASGGEVAAKVMGGNGNGSKYSRGFLAKRERKKLVEEVLLMLDLSVLRNQRVGSVADKSLSGGQRKRVNIGVELVARPPVLLLDEPTSGLPHQDAACSSDVLMSLSDLVEERGFNVIMVVHQPRRTVYELFNTIMVLDRQGRSVYNGKPDEARSYFLRLGYTSIPENENVADTILDIIMGKYYSPEVSSGKLPIKEPPVSPVVDKPAADYASNVSSPTEKGAPAGSRTTSNRTVASRANSQGTPDLSEGLVSIVTHEFDRILGEGAAKRGDSLNREGLLKLFKRLGQKGREVEAFVQGLLEEADGMRARGSSAMDYAPKPQAPQTPQNQTPLGASSSSKALICLASAGPPGVSRQELLAALQKVLNDELKVGGLRSPPPSRGKHPSFGRKDTARRDGLMSQSLQGLFCKKPAPANVAQVMPAEATCESGAAAVHQTNFSSNGATAGVPPTCPQQLNLSLQLATIQRAPEGNGLHSARSQEPGSPEPQAAEFTTNARQPIRSPPQLELPEDCEQPSAEVSRPSPFCLAQHQRTVLEDGDGKAAFDNPPASIDHSGLQLRKAGSSAVVLSGPIDIVQQVAVRGLPSRLSQVATFSRRAMLQSSRAYWPSSMFEVALLLTAAAAVGANQGRYWGATDVPGNLVMSLLCLAVLAVVQHLRTFSSNRLVVHRERSAGLSITAYFTARCLVDVPWIVVAPIYFSLPYYVLTVPRASYLCYYALSVAVWWWASGLSYLVTATPFLPKTAAPTAAVLLTLIAGALLNGVSAPTLAQSRGNTVTEIVLGFSFSRWAVEALSILELDKYLDSHGNVILAMYAQKGFCRVDMALKDENGSSTLDTALMALINKQSPSSFVRHYCHDDWRSALSILFCLGLGLRIVACTVLAYDKKILEWWGNMWLCLSRSGVSCSKEAADSSAHGDDDDEAEEDGEGGEKEARQLEWPGVPSTVAAVNSSNFPGALAAQAPRGAARIWCPNMDLTALSFETSIEPPIKHC
ncbi:hypothetical protein VOLCADRAFT_93888 [Volvox carteri f. nagariensis]|uniref:ABC transporter domain-containing protein n=1 Tax=Volvox carteri f. nagariensis TaxID=3068 RepID=D8U3C0_VOLCA|nr:uncharacterized protein VOLCADRAFT_93888 [Volvox carteri f. nagariensis]EFJ45799.1 hypothetical protein VOLCADRAFT_93888 [Volvox carteri f. nagariensis]|eukprot:XP_002953200.1 hypothetical protein VOLCADRAFT_93888 [Volvox carteri f. nagariensis]